MPPTPPPGSAARHGYWAALAAAAGGALAGLVSPAPGGLMCVLFLAVALGVRRQHAWAPIAGVCFLLAPIPIAATHVPAEMTAGFVAASLFEVALAFFLAQAAIELWHDPGNRGILPWAPLSAVFVLFWLLFEPFAITGASMERTIFPGDQLLVETVSWRLGRAADLGEMVVIRSPVDHRQHALKRVVAGPGDRIRIRARRLYRNGDPIDEPYAYYATAAPDPSRDDFPSPSPIRLASAAEDMLRYHVRQGEVLVPDGKYFVLGDNREDSVDSRQWGFLSEQDIVGSPLLVYASYDPARRGPIGNSITNLRWNRIGKLAR